jgi:FdhD protein
LWSEGVLTNFDHIESVRGVGLPQGESRTQNIVQVHLKTEVDFARLNRNFYTTSSCGVCGKASLNAVAQLLETIEYSQGDVKVSATTIHALPQTLRASQNAFEQTGGLHAAALFDASGNLIAAREDVGRHNALDKLLGSQLLRNALPLRDKIVLVSGRASFELVQKTLMAGAPILAAVGAPSSLAVDLAKRFGLTLLGFVRNGRFNTYSGFERII